MSGKVIPDCHRPGDRTKQRSGRQPLPRTEGVLFPWEHHPWRNPALPRERAAGERWGVRAGSWPDRNSDLALRSWGGKEHPFSLRLDLPGFLPEGGGLSFEHDYPQDPNIPHFPVDGIQPPPVQSGAATELTASFPEGRLGSEGWDRSCGVQGWLKEGLLGCSNRKGMRGGQQAAVEGGAWERKGFQVTEGTEDRQALRPSQVRV